MKAGNPLNHRLGRQLKANAGKYLGMVVILITTIALGSAFQVTLDGAFQYLDEAKTIHLQEDGYFETTHPLEPAVVEKLETLPVQVAPIPGVLKEAEDFEAKVLLFAPRQKLDLPVLFEGEFPVLADEIALDHVFARTHELGLQDTIRLNGTDYKITGTVSLPDYTSLFLNNTDLVMNTSAFGVGLFSEAGYEEQNPDQITWRYAYKWDDVDLSLAQKGDLEKEMQTILVKNMVPLQSFLPGCKNQSITFLEMDMGTDGPTMTAFVYILIALIAFVFAIMTSSLLEKESVAIGTLLACGYTPKELLSHYLLPSLIVSLVGSLLGNLLGYTLMIQPFLDLYYTTYSIGPIAIHFSWPAFVLTTMTPVILMLAINLGMLAWKLRLPPLRFLRKELKTKKRKKAVSLPNWSFPARFRLRVIVQNKGSYLILFLGIFLSSFLLMFGLGLNPLMDHYSKSIEQSLPYEYQYILKGPLPEGIPEKAEALLLQERNVWFDLGDKDMSVTLIGLDPDSSFFEEAARNHQVLASSALANKLHLKVGDTLELKDPYTENSDELEIEGIYPYDASMAIFLPATDLETLLEVPEGTYNALISQRSLDISDDLLIKTITRKDLAGAATQMMNSFDSVIVFIQVFSVLVYMILMYILTKVILDKNALSISYMKVFGYTGSEISRFYLHAAFLVVVVSLIICIPAEIALFKLILVYISSMVDGYLAFWLPWWVYAGLIAIGLIVYLAVTALHMHTISKIPMNDALKHRE